jgi:hypothetical protein
VVPVSGFRDQTHRITYLPWGNVRLGAVGWEVWPDRSNRNILVYIVPSTATEGELEIRCHLTWDDPDPTSDQLLGCISIPIALLDPEQ